MAPRRSRLLRTRRRARKRDPRPSPRTDTNRCQPAPGAGTHLIVRLYIMRHGPAEDHAASGRDFDRALTASGRERVRDVARALVEGGEAPLVILTSPLVRALQTAEIVAGVVQLAEEKGGEAASVEIRRDLSPDGDCEAFARK